MCGIAGILRVHPPGAPPPPPEVAIPESWLDILDESIKHRGPDGQGRFRDRAVRADGTVVDVALVHRRLAIIDIKDGNQPMVSPRGRNEGEGLVAVVFNGCIYNHRELRKELQAAGHRFETDHSDTEVLVHGWREWGEHIFQHLDGMFAFALWDRGSASLILARDAFGEKPMYTTAGHAGGAQVLAFSVVASGLIRLQHRSGVVPVANPSTPWSQIKPWVQFGWNLGDMAAAHVRELTPGGASRWGPDHTSRFGCGTGLTGSLSWAGGLLNPDGRPVGAETIDSMIATSVESRLTADVPVGCFLSGGIDSSLVLAHAARSKPDLIAYTVRMPDGAMDESEHATAVAKHLGVRHRVLDCDPRPAEDLPALIQQLGLPFGDSSLLPTHWVSRAARKEVPVALSGDGGDELFMGYDRHRAIRWLAMLDRLARDRREALAEAFPFLGHPIKSRDRLARLLSAAAHNGYKDLVAIFPPPLDAELGLTRRGAFGFGAIHHWGMTATEPWPYGGVSRHERDKSIANLALRFDRLFYLSCDLLRKTDTASMSVALEVRAPLLNREIAATVVNAPVECLMPRGQRKGLLRQVARKYLPAEIVDRPKMGFAIPIGEWFRSDYGGMKQLLMDHLNSAEPWGPASLGIDLNMKFVRQMLDEHMGTGPSGRVVRDHSQRLYMLLVLSIWAKWIGSL